jgi:hypothetical protein
MVIDDLDLLFIINFSMKLGKGERNIANIRPSLTMTAPVRSWGKKNYGNWLSYFDGFL